MTLTSDQKTQLFYNRGQSLTALSWDLAEQLRTLTIAVTQNADDQQRKLEQVLNTTAKISTWNATFHQTA